MSLDDFRGAAFALRTWHRDVKDEIDRGERKGAVIRWKRANPAKVGISWFKRLQMLKRRA